MTFRTNVVATLAICALPAFGFAWPSGHTSVLATFVYACPGSHPAPRVRTRFTVSPRPAARPASSPVAVYSRGQVPGRRYRLVGTVDVVAHGHDSSLDELTERARRAARTMGGDAIVEMWWDDAGHTRPQAGEVGDIYLTADVARWEQ